MLPCVSVSIASKTLVHPSAAPKRQLDTSLTRFSLPVQLLSSLSRPLSVLRDLQEAKKNPPTQNARHTADRRRGTSDGSTYNSEYLSCRDARKGQRQQPHVSLFWGAAGKAGARRVACRSWWCQWLVPLVVVGPGRRFRGSRGTLYICFFESLFVKDCCVGFSYDLSCGPLDTGF
ncbi:hypothetical protein BDP81DRAFT_10517 [Colletotrichum phormii]|uniref:Uncharacterized protein n=1 Tax=Colletotrichum phormii TaxID=359342 RepID=A0AAJ0ENV0_9PEZI|nr:uncharacterized protein BDP81DRAFT_10517 [Colletotrichum phormii]KAK1655818.1 hypothetical protein BDP81DRAFT_10517 [Colletotrichum phormii]